MHNIKNRLLLPLLLVIFSISSANGQWYAIVGSALSALLDLISLETTLFPYYPDRQFEINLQKKFDFIIVGSSPSGAALANRLSENPNVSVLLLENGEEPSQITDVPIIAGAFGFTKYSYGYKTEPQPGFCTGCTEGRMFWEHGKAIGGSTIINYMLYMRGNRRDYDRWAALGNPGWAYDDLLPLFKKIEDNRVQITDPGYTGTGGYLTISDVGWKTPLSGIYINAAKEAGHNYVDYNGKEQIGVSYVQATLTGGRRDSAEKSYLRDIRTRMNLKIQGNSLVTKILINSENNTAYGVEYVHNYFTYRVYANKEVILSAGVLNSPQLLMLSGIGPAEHLNQLGIPLIQDLPVGKKMYDHAAFPLIAYTLNQSISINPLQEILNPNNVLEFFSGKGFFNSPGGVEAVTYIKTNVSTDPDPLYPDIELLVIGGTVADDIGIIFRNMYNIPPIIYDKIFKPLEFVSAYQATPVLLHPRSYGSIKLKTKNPRDPPLFYANYLSDPEEHDLKTFVAGIRAFQKINASPALQKVGAKIVSTPAPGCEHEPFDSDNYWKCAVKLVTGSYFHMVATCKMGPKSDTEAVVDHELKVHNVNRLRVVDTSVIPIPPSSHNMAPGYVIGEKAAIIIKSFWGI